MKNEVQYSLVAVLATFLVGCGGGSSSSDSSVDEGNNQSLATLDGRAAVGAPITGATVSARCMDGSGFVDEVTTDNSGLFSGRVESDSLPCALRVNGGSEETTLHSFAQSAGTVNITPLTDMILALSSSEAPEVWFNRDDRNTQVANLESAGRDLMGVLRESSYELPNDEFDPFRTPFTIGDTVDRVLDALGEAIGALPAVDSYPAFLALIADGNLAAIPDAPASNGGGEDGGSGGGGDQADNGSAAACFSTLLVSSGSQIEARRRTYDPNSGTETGENVIRQENGGQTTFRGESVRVINVETFEEPETDLIGKSRTYATADEDALVLSSYGVESIDSEDGSVTSSQWFEPTNDFHYDLNPGESFRQIYTVYQSLGDGPATIVENVDWTVTYTGREIITVPAGTFETCKFSIEMTGNQFTSAPVVWRNVGDGVEVQSAITGDSGSERVTTELLGYSVNGVQQAP